MPDINSMQPLPFSRMTEAQKLAALGPHSVTMATALEQIYMSMSRRVPGGMTLRRWCAQMQASQLSEGAQWDVEAAQAVIDALDAIGSGVVL